jgi:hypothetical protein
MHNNINTYKMMKNVTKYSSVGCELETEVDLASESDKIKKNGMGRACSTYGGGERHVQSFGGET